MASSNWELSEKARLGKDAANDFLGENLFSEIENNMTDDIFTHTNMEYIWETCFASYRRPHLKWRERSLMNLAMLIALGRGPELRLHLRAAAHNGLSEETVCEAIRHAMIYCGVPAGRDAMLTASDVFRNLKASGEYPKRE